MIGQREKKGEIFISTREIANAMNLTIYQARAYLMNLLASGVVDRTTIARGKPVMWFLT
ncbi:FaeA/PapI family transcriptional regulator [Escherichia coli]